MYWDYLLRWAIFGRVHVSSKRDEKINFSTFLSTASVAVLFIHTLHPKKKIHFGYFLICPLFLVLLLYFVCIFSPLIFGYKDVKKLLGNYFLR